MMHPFNFPLMRHPRPAVQPPPIDDPSQNDAEAASTPMPGSFPESSSPGAAQDDAESYQPSVLDVIVTKAMLVKALTLPLELVDRIIDLAEYWPHTSAELDYRPSPRTVARGSSPIQDAFLLRTLPLGFVKPVHPDPERYKTEPAKTLRLSSEHPVKQFQDWIGSPSDALHRSCRKIVFTITSNDQGWGGGAGFQNTYRGSYTWFEAGLERIDASGECGNGCPDHPRSAGDGSTESTSSSRPHISPCAMRPIVPPVVGEPHERPRMEHPLNPVDEYKIQCNRTASREAETYTVEWRADDRISPGTPEAEKLAEAGRGVATGTGEFVRSLKLGDVVSVWAKARFVGWENQLHFLKVDVYWAL